MFELVPAEDDASPIRCELHKSRLRYGHYDFAPAATKIALENDNMVQLVMTEPDQLARFFERIHFNSLPGTGFKTFQDFYDAWLFATDIDDIPLKNTLIRELRSSVIGENQACVLPWNFADEQEKSKAVSILSAIYEHDTWKN